MFETQDKINIIEYGKIKEILITFAYSYKYKR